jgi:hypothetical protein
LDHRAPQPGCNRGMWAYTDLNHRDINFYEHPNLVLGTIEAWGRLENRLRAVQRTSRSLLFDQIGAPSGSGPTGLNMSSPIPASTRSWVK